MRITVFTHYFWPELGAPSARLLELGRAWVARGHQVSVVTNFPNHPTGVVPEAYRGRSFLVEKKDGLRILRCRTYATPNRGFVRKTLGHLFFMLQAVVQATPHVRDTEVVIASSPTLFAAVAAFVVSRRLGVPFVFEVRDLWPAIFVDLGVIRNRAVIWCLERLELFLYRRAAAVVTVTRAFADDIGRRGIAAVRLHVVPNGVDLKAFQPGPADASLRLRLGLDGRFVFLYCGAHGISHALGRLLEVAARLRDDPRLFFLFVGEGAEKDALVEQARVLGLTNVAFQPAVAREEVPALYRSADVCLVPLRAVPLFRAFIPSKMFEILACGRPVLASLEGESGEILEESGAAVVVPPEDVEAITAAARRFAADAALCGRLALSGRSYVAAHFDREALAERYLAILERVSAAGPRPSPRASGL